MKYRAFQTGLFRAILTGYVFGFLQTWKKSMTNWHGAISILFNGLGLLGRGPDPPLTRVRTRVR